MIALMAFSRSTRPPQTRWKRKEAAGPAITAHGAFVKTPEGKHLAVIGTAKDPFGADRDSGATPQSLEELEERLDRNPTRRRAS